MFLPYFVYLLFSKSVPSSSLFSLLMLSLGKYVEAFTPGVNLLQWIQKKQLQCIFTEHINSISFLVMLRVFSKHLQHKCNVPL